ncbi:MAG: ATP synthase F1 subunit gamma [Clostridiales bacterium]|nr:MAG: ATP synthase F1 subunit gamma [Clostridiales bacterium]
MAGVGARDIKRKIKSINSTKQITKAMELVSTAKLKKNKARFESTKPYFNKVISTVESIVKNEVKINHPLANVREVKKILYVVISADKGLCGGYNVNVLKEAERVIKSKENSVILTVGKKATDFFIKRNYNISNSFVGISEKPSFHDAKNIIRICCELYKDKKVDEVHLVYTEMLSAISLLPTTKMILPVKFDDIKEVEEETNNSLNDEIVFEKDLIAYEPSPEEVLNMLIPNYLESLIYSALIETAAAEQSARRNAMESASDNAQEMIETLTLNYNQARQAAITQEISEIVGGANALE